MGWTDVNQTFVILAVFGCCGWTLLCLIAIWVHDLIKIKKEKKKGDKKNDVKRGTGEGS